MPLLLAILIFCAGFPNPGIQGQGVSLGPKDGAALTPTDTGRVAVGSAAPDFALESLTSAPVTLSQLRGKQNVVLVFYRGFW